MALAPIIFFMAVLCIISIVSYIYSSSVQLQIILSLVFWLAPKHAVSFHVVRLEIPTLSWLAEIPSLPEAKAYYQAIPDSHQQGTRNFKSLFQLPQASSGHGTFSRHIIQIGQVLTSPTLSMHLKPGNNTFPDGFPHQVRQVEDVEGIFASLRPRVVTQRHVWDDEWDIRWGC